MARRDSRTTNTVTHAVTAVHSQARCRPARQPVSSTYAAGCACTSARASATGAAKACTVAGSKFAMVPMLMEMPNRSSMALCVARFDR